MSALTAAHALRPKDFHEIARLCLSEVVEVAAETQLMKKARRARPVRIPAAPNAFAIALISNDQLIERGEVELKLATLAQGLDRSNKNEVGRAGTEARVRRFWNNKEFPRFKMRSGLQSNFGEMGDGIFAAARHFFDLVEDERVEIGRHRFNDTQPENGDAGASDLQQFQHAGQLSAKFKEGKARDLIAITMTKLE